MSEFRMPALGADMEAGTLVEWLKQPGDAVKRGDIVAVVDTQKGAIEIEVYEEGVLERTVVHPGEKVPVGTVLAVIRGAGEPVTGMAARAPAAEPLGREAPGAGAPGGRPPGPARAKAGGRPVPPAPRPFGTHRRRVTPVARRAAAERYVDLASVTGTGPDGAITLDDVMRAAAVAAPVPEKMAAPAAGDRNAAMRAAIAAAMARSKREIPHFYMSTTIDLSRALSWLSTENAARPVTERVLPFALLVKAVARALVEVPEFNGFWIDGRFRPGEAVHVGCAIALRDGGLVAPAIHDVPGKSLTTLMGALRDLVGRARSGSLRSSELADPTITVTNLGDMGVEATFGVIYPPQVAIVGFGRVADRPWVVEGAVVPRSLVTATLSADHRAADGHRGGLFLAAVDRALQTPEAL